MSAFLSFIKKDQGGSRSTLMDRDLIAQSQIFLKHSIRPKINHGPHHMALANPSGPPVLIQVCIESLYMLISNLVVSPHAK